MIEFIAQFQKSQQITEDSWEIVTPTLKVTESTTVGEILKWYSKHLPRSPMDVKIIQLAFIDNPNT